MKRYFLITIIILSACHSKKTSESVALVHPQFSPGPHALVYKTKKDYSKLVAVILGEDGTIVSYPHPGDLKNDSVAYPLVLENGYYLDRKGINKNVAYLKWSIKTYSEMDTVPSLAAMQAMMEDRDPLVEMCDCGSLASFNQIQNELNAIIKRDSLKSICKIVK